MNRRQLEKLNKVSKTILKAVLYSTVGYALLTTFIVLLQGFFGAALGNTVFVVMLITVACFYVATWVILSGGDEGADSKELEGGYPSRR